MVTRVSFPEEIRSFLSGTRKILSSTIELFPLGPLKMMGDTFEYTTKNERPTAGRAPEPKDRTLSEKQYNRETFNGHNVSDLAKLAAHAYQDDEVPQLPDGIKLLEVNENPDSGFGATVYKNQNNEIIIAYRGTDEQGATGMLFKSDSLKGDWKSNSQIKNDELPEQYEDAQALYEKIKKAYPNAKITLTGHSLGGSLAQLVASSNKEPIDTITFNAYGTETVCKNNNFNSNAKRVINYVNTKDTLVGNSAKDHFGVKYEVKFPDYVSPESEDYSELVACFDAHKITHFVKS